MLTDIMFPIAQWKLLCGLVCVQHAFYCCHNEPRVITLCANQKNSCLSAGDISTHMTLQV